MKTDQISLHNPPKDIAAPKMIEVGPPLTNVFLQRGLWRQSGNINSVAVQDAQQEWKQTKEPHQLYVRILTQ